MHWNYRVVRHEDGTLVIHEVYYAPDGTPELMTVNPSYPMADSLPALRDRLGDYASALMKPVLPVAIFTPKENQCETSSEKQTK